MPVGATRARALGLCALVLAVALRARAKDRTDGAVMVYSDTDHVTVVAPSLSGSMDLGDTTTLTAHAASDFITAASVDLVTAASPGGFSETRTEGGAGAKLTLGDGRFLDGSYTLSHEPDFETHTFTASGTRDLFDRRATVTLDYSYSYSAVGRAHDSSFLRTRGMHQADLSWSYVLSPAAVGDLSYGFTLVDGYQANPYRFVRLYLPGADSHETAVPETTPDLRLRHAVTARLRTRLAPELFALVDYRLYADSWGMLAHTVRARLSLSTRDEAWTFALEGRGYLQNGADFYRARYDTFPDAPVYRTAEKELGPMWTALAGAHLEWTPAQARWDELHVGAGVDVLYMRYLDYLFLTSRTATVASVDATWAF